MTPPLIYFSVFFSSFSGYSKKADGVDVMPEKSTPRSPFHVYKQTRMLLFTMVFLAQDTLMVNDRNETVCWLTLLPVFVYMEALLSVMTYKGMTLPGFILFRDETFRMLRAIVNAPGNIRTLDSGLLEVSKSTDVIMRQFNITHPLITTSEYGSVAANEGENSTDSSMFGGHQTKQLQEKLAYLEKDLSDKNKHINHLMGRRLLQRKLNDVLRRLDESTGAGSHPTVNRPNWGRDSAENSRRARDRSHSREPRERPRVRSRSGPRVTLSYESTKQW